MCKWDLIASSGIIAGLLSKFLLTNREIGLPESFLYIMLAIVIAGYWSFQAWIRFKKEASDLIPFKEEVKKLAGQCDELSETIDSHNSKINGLLLRIGLK